MSTLSEAELARIARNREKARIIKNSKLYKPYARKDNESQEESQNEPNTKR